MQIVIDRFSLTMTIGDNDNGEWALGKLTESWLVQNGFYYKPNQYTYNKRDILYNGYYKISMRL